MNTKKILVGVFISLYVFFISFGKEVVNSHGECPILKGSYLGQNTPGIIPEIFAQGIISTGSHEFSCCFSPEGKEFYFSRRNPEIGKPVIMVSKIVDGVWSKPNIASFVEDSYSFEPWITPDNQRLYFQSGKVIPGQPGPAMNILYVEREDDGWSEAMNLGAPFNPAKAMHITSSLDGTIYTTDISSGPGNESLAIVEMVKGEYHELKKLGLPFNKELSMHPYISPDKNYIIFGVLRPDQKIDKVLLYSNKRKDGTWQEPREINLGMNAGLPFVTSDGKILFFTSGEQGEGDIYWVSTDIINELVISNE